MPNSFALALWRALLILAVPFFVVILIVAGLLAGPVIVIAWLQQEFKQAWHAL